MTLVDLNVKVFVGTITPLVLMICVLPTTTNEGLKSLFHQIIVADGNPSSKIIPHLPLVSTTRVPTKLKHWGLR